MGLVIKDRKGVNNMLSSEENNEPNGLLFRSPHLAVLRRQYGARDQTHDFSVQNTCTSQLPSPNYMFVLVLFFWGFHSNGCFDDEQNGVKIL